MTNADGKSLRATCTVKLKEAQHLSDKHKPNLRYEIKPSPEEWERRFRR